MADPIQNGARLDPSQYHLSAEPMGALATPAKVEADGVESFGGQQSATGNAGPTGGARDATLQPEKSAEEIAQDSLATNRDYQAHKKLMDEWGSVVDDLNLIDNIASNGNPDGKITFDDIKAVAQNPDCDPQARAAAQKLLKNMQVLQILDGDGDKLIGIHRAAAWLSDISAILQQHEDGARSAASDQVSARQSQAATGPNGAAAPAGGASANPAAGTSTTNQATTDVLKEADQTLPKPAPSDKTGLEGASENMNNLIGWGEAEIDRLTSLMAKTDDPAALKALENKINQMSRRMQQMTALMNQLMTMMSNISKMYSDIAMNSVRNMR